MDWRRNFEAEPFEAQSMRPPRWPVTLQWLIAAVAVSGLVAYARHLDITRRRRDQVREAQAMRKNDPDSAAAREYLLGTWLTSHDPRRSEMKDTPEEMAEMAAFIWRVAKKSGAGPVSTRSWPAGFLGSGSRALPARKPWPACSTRYRRATPTRWRPTGSG